VLLANLANSLLTNGRIKTTLPKAKELRPFVEKIITICKRDAGLTSRRRVISILGDTQAVERLFNSLREEFSQRNGGYVRIFKFGFRGGDNAPLALVELVLHKEEEKL
jgi:large subunit ribosomal protein L17